MDADIPVRGRHRGRVVVMNHADHEPGTIDDCPDCRALALEPGWYKVMREDRVVARPDQVLVPEVGESEIDVVVVEVPTRPDIEVPDLERADVEG
jgi:hypothetical protein